MRKNIKKFEKIYFELSFMYNNKYNRRNKKLGRKNIY